MTDQQWMELALYAGAKDVSMTDVRDIPFTLEFRGACKENICGHYGSNWMCPPLVGDMEELMKRAQGYDRALVYQTVFDIRGREDKTGIRNGKLLHHEVSQRILEGSPKGDILHLSAGACHICERCAAIEKEPCRHPEQAMSSPEAYGMHVGKLAELCNLPYSDGMSTVTYFGMVLFHKN